MNGAIPKILKVDDLKKLSLDTMIEAYRNGYRVEENSPEIKRMATCPTASKMVGSVVTISATPSGGTPPYTVDFRKDGVILPGGQRTGVLANQTVTHNYTLVAADVGTHTFSSIAYDSCPGNPQASLEDSCTVTVAACPALTTASASCPTGSIPVGGAATFGATWTGGVAPYTVRWYKDTDTTAFATTTVTTGTTSSTSVTTTGWTVGTHNIKVTVTDSCTPVAQSYSSLTCPMSIVSACAKPIIAVNVV